MNSLAAFLGDGEQKFLLTPELITELEGKLGSSIGAICNRVFARAFTQADLSETIRLALVGGGIPAKRAAELVTVYVLTRPLTDNYELASKILERVLFGRPNEKEAIHAS